MEASQSFSDQGHSRHHYKKSTLPEGLLIRQVRFFDEKGDRQVLLGSTSSIALRLKTLSRKTGAVN